MVECRLLTALLILRGCYLATGGDAHMRNTMPKQWALLMKCITWPMRFAQPSEHKE
jgi:hypothetical protein